MREREPINRLNPESDVNSQMFVNGLTAILDHAVKEARELDEVLLAVEFNQLKILAQQFVNEGYSPKKKAELLTDLKEAFENFEAVEMQGDQDTAGSMIIIRNLLIGAINFVENGSKYVESFAETAEIRKEQGRQANGIIEA